MRKLPPLNYLQAFEAAARHKSFSEAARELNCTQAAISQRIRGLETIFGRSLFQRLPSGVQPTEAAEVYLKGIGDALDQLSSITRGLAGVRSAKTVSVSVPVTFASIWLAPRLHIFLKSYPDIDVRFNCTIWNDPNSETADFQIQLLDSDRKLANGYRLTRDKAFAVCAPHLLARRNGSQANVFFEDQPLITLIAKYDYWTLWSKKMGGAKIGNGRKIAVDTGVLAIELARAGYGLALTLETYSRPYIERGELVKPFAEDIDLELSHFILSPEDQKLSRPAELFREFLVEESKRALPAPRKRRPRTGGDAGAKQALKASAVIRLGA
jgi:LysR family glycine cleavage system transcriptional activator